MLYPEEVSAYILAKLIDQVELQTGSTVSKAVISVPAYFDHKQKAATLEAGKIAGRRLGAGGAALGR